VVATKTLAATALVGAQTTINNQIKAAAATAINMVLMAYQQCQYDTQVVQYNAPRTPQPCETFPLLIAMIKWYPVLGEHSRIISSLWKLFCRGEQLARDENRVSILVGNI
jgi:hypothetical protein